MDPILLRAPGRALSLTTLLGRLVVGLDETLCQQLLGRGAVTLGARRLRSASRDVPPGSLLGLDSEGIELVPEPPNEVGDAFDVLVPAPPWPSGRLAPVKGAEIGYSVRRIRSGVAELSLRATGTRTHEVLAALAAAGWPVLADGRRGGILVDGGPRIRLASSDFRGTAQAASAWWPNEPVFAVRPEDDKSLPEWRISHATARALERGHPWILPDDESDDPERLAPGSLVQLVDSQHRALGEARIEGAGPVAARVWSLPGVGQGGSSLGVAARVARAVERRRPLMRKGSARCQHRGEPYTDAIRLVNGEADGLPGLAVDRLGPLLRVLVQGRACASLVGPVVDALRDELADLLGDATPVVEVLHLRVAPPGRHLCVRVLTQGGSGSEAEAHAIFDDAGLIVRERGLRFRVDPGLAEPDRPRPGTGLYLDQRENRERLAKLARSGGRWLNLFAHTGAFSVALLAAGAEEVTSVDLSGAYLRWLESNIALNQDRGVLAERHRSVRRDGRRYLSKLASGERFDGIVLDPPTAAAAGRRFWSAGRDLEPLVAEALMRLSPGGVLLVCRNERRAKRRLQDVLRRASETARVRIGPLREAGPGADFPRLAGFAEGTSFQGAIVQRS